MGYGAIMYARKTPAYGSGHYAKPLNIPAKVGYQAPREDVARPFKAREYNQSGYYSIYQGTNYVGAPQAGSAVSPLKTFAEKELARSEDPTIGARTAIDNRDARLHPH